MKYQTCRFCKVTTTDGNFIKYAIRSNACPRCFLKQKGKEGLETLPLWKLERFPAMVAHDFGLYETLGDLIHNKRDKEALCAKEGC